MAVFAGKGTSGRPTTPEREATSGSVRFFKLPRWEELLLAAAAGLGCFLHCYLCFFLTIAYRMRAEGDFFLYSSRDESACFVSSKRFEKGDDFTPFVVYASSNDCYSLERCAKREFSLVLAMDTWQLIPFLRLIPAGQVGTDANLFVSFIRTSSARDYCLVTTDTVGQFKSARKSEERMRHLERVRKLSVFGTVYGGRETSYGTWDFAFSATDGRIVEKEGTVSLQMMRAIVSMTSCPKRGCPSCVDIFSSFAEVQRHFREKHVAKCTFCDKHTDTTDHYSLMSISEAKSDNIAPDGVSHLLHIIAVGLLDDRSSRFVSCASRLTGRIASLRMRDQKVKFQSHGNASSTGGGDSGGGQKQEQGDFKGERKDQSSRPSSRNNNNNNDQFNAREGGGGDGGGGEEDGPQPMDEREEVEEVLCWFCYYSNQEHEFITKETVLVELEEGDPARGFIRHYQTATHGDGDGDMLHVKCAISLFERNFNCVCGRSPRLFNMHGVYIENPPIINVINLNPNPNMLVHDCRNAVCMALPGCRGIDSCHGFMRCGVCNCDNNICNGGD